MKVYFFMGRNPKNVSGVSWKIWKIEQKGRAVSVWWGRVSVIARKVTPIGTLQHKKWSYRTEALAEKNASMRIAQKLATGYERNPKRRAR